MSETPRDITRAAQFVYEAFATDLRQGYRTKDKVFAVEVLGQALGLPIRVEPASETKDPTRVLSEPGQV